MDISGISNSYATNAYSNRTYEANSNKNAELTKSLSKEDKTKALMEKLSQHMDEMAEKIKNGDTEETYQIGGQSFTMKEWDKLMQKVDKQIDAVKEEIEKEKEEQEEQEKIEELNDASLEELIKDRSQEQKEALPQL